MFSGAKSEGLTGLCSGGSFRNSYVFHDMCQKYCDNWSPQSGGLNWG